MKKLLAAIAAMNACVAPAVAADCGAVATEGRYSLVCRGPLTYEMYQRNGRGTPGFATEVVYHIDAAPDAAGLHGVSLQPGRCAWSDRPLSREEPRKLGFIVNSDKPGDLSPMAPQMWDNVQTCLGDSNCRVSFCAAGANHRLFIIDIDEKWLEALGSYAQIHYVGTIRPYATPPLDVDN
ncbi:MAG: hypothetical protein ABL957_02035 [Parvularculaceae bacterium]